ncbi:CHITINASE (CLASS IB) / HEVEIN [Salix koriyanagi]|uniref:CHITINASE (CLASS IB) / HEVEIN n=1 Tax=Salix koriyanagi TaxID=2511006 RepID=A0A9Q0SGL4_9ROSI|nr:CHITINASE (CLASS IB) / HEVEIN [Salix koriyanagi]
MEGARGNGFYTYDAFISAARSFGGFGTSGDDTDTSKGALRFLGSNLSRNHRLGKRSPNSVLIGSMALPIWNAILWPRLNSTYSVNLAFNSSFRFDPTQETRTDFDLLTLSATHNYGLSWSSHWRGSHKQSGLGSKRPVISFKTGAANRVPGYGVITNIINGGLECGSGANDKVADRIGFYRRYCDLLGVSYGDNLDCYNQRPFA